MQESRFRNGKTRHRAPPQLIVLSGATQAALDTQVQRLRMALEQGAPALDDLAFALQSRAQQTHRLAFACTTLDELRQALAGPATRRAACPDAMLAPRLAFVFSGGGVQYPGMGRELYGHAPVFRDAVDACRATLRTLGAPDLLPACLPGGTRRRGLRRRHPPTQPFRHRHLCLPVCDASAC